MSFPVSSLTHLPMEGRREIPSQPSNFVSILHLRERWLKENEQNQKEKEEQKQPEQQVQQQKVQVQQTEHEEKNDQKPVDVKPVVQKPRIRSRNRSRKFPRYYRAVPASNPRNVNEMCKKTEDEGEPLLAVSPIESDEKKKKSKKKGRKKKPRAQNEEMDRTSRTPEEKENLKEEMRETEREVGEQNEKKDVRARRIDERKGVGSQCGSETGNTNEMKEMENKLSRISVSFEIKRGRINGVYRGSSQGNRNFRDHRNLHPWAPRKQRDVGMIWVRKDELPKGA